MRGTPLIAMTVAVVSLAAACSLRKPPSVENYYAQGELMFAQGEYNNAIENYQHLIDAFPFSPYAEDAELKIGLAYYQMKEYGEASVSLGDFMRMHPTNKNLHLASYYLATSYFDQMGRADQDQTNTESALHQFEVLEQRFPESPFAELSHERIAICREMLARNQLVVSDFYFARANYRAAESRLAELMQKYPDTPVAAEALYDLGTTLEKEGKKYSSAQAFAALVQHFPKTSYAPKAKRELKKLDQPIDNEEDPLRLVLAESGFSQDDAENKDHVIVRQRESLSSADSGSTGSAAYGADGLPIFDRPRNDSRGAQQARASGRALLRTIRLGASDPPLSVIFDLSGPVDFDKNFENGPDGSTLTVRLKRVTPESSLERHLVFDRSVFKDCEIETDAEGTIVRVHTEPVERFAIVPLEEPARLLITFTPRTGQAGEASSGL